MAKYFRTYRTDTCRLPNHDYASGCFYITIDAIHHKNYFGEIRQKKMFLSDLGAYAVNAWLNTPAIRPNVILDDFVVMPDHFHAILFLNKTSESNHPAIKKFGPQSNNLAAVIRGFKGTVKSYADKNNIDFSWQPRYYDVIIRSESEYFNCKNYITDNVIKFHTAT
jgi:putative transposase